MKGEYSLTEKVYQLLRDDILNGNFEDGHELKENTLAKKYEVSRTPVREAIRQLALEGLVETIPNRGAFVKTIKIKDVMDVYAIRSLMEGLAARWACDHITTQQLEEMEEIVYLCGYYREKELWDHVFQADSRFHELLYEASGSEILEHTLKNFHTYIRLVRKSSLHDRTRAHDAFQEHEAIMKAIKEKRHDDADHLATEHIAKAFNNWKSKMEAATASEK